MSQLEQAGEAPQLSRDEAVALTRQITESLALAWEHVVAAYHGRAWLALGYETWDGYCNGEFGAVRLRLPQEERQQSVKSLRDQGLSLRAIAAVTGFTHTTIKNDERAIEEQEGQNFPRPPTVGMDGKTYASRTESDEVIDAEIVEDDDMAGEATEDGGMKRRSLALQFRKPVTDASRVGRRLAELMADDRFRRNRKNLAETYGPQLRLAHDELSALVKALDESL